MIGGINTSRGINRGAAQVYDTSAPINTYAKLMQQQQLRRAAETKALTDELGKVTPEGLRQPDVKGFIDQYGRWRDKSIEADAERNPVRKAVLKQEAEREKLATMMYKDDSKNELINERKRKEFLMNPENRRRYPKEVLATIINSANFSKDDPKYIRDINQFEIKPDLSKITKLLDDTDNNLRKFTKPELVQEQGERLGIKGLYEYNVTTLSPAEQAAAYGVLFDTNDEFASFLRSLNPEFNDLSEKQLREVAIPVLVQKRPKSTYSDKKFIEPKDLTMQNLAIQRERRLAAGGGGGDFPEDYAVERIQLTTEPQYDKNEEPIIGTEKPSLTLEKTVKTRSVPFPSTQMKAFDVANNKRIVLPARQDLKLARLAYVPTIAKDGRYELQAVVIDKDNMQYVIQETEVPIDIRRTTAYRAAKTALGSPPPPKGAKATKPTITKYSQLQEDGISFLMEKNKGATREQIINSLIKAGKLPK